MLANMENKSFQDKIPQLWELYRKNHWPDQWFYDVLKEFHIWSLHSLRCGGDYKVSDDQNAWFEWIFSGKIVRIGRLEYDFSARFGGKVRVFRKDTETVLFAEQNLTFNKKGYRAEHGWCSILEETDDYWKGNRILNGLAEQKIIHLDKNEWKMVLQFEDPMIAIHIPEDGPLSTEACIESFHEASGWLNKHKPDWKGFYCQSWLLDPVFQKIVSPDSNTVRFQKMGHLYPMGTHSDLEKRIYPGKLLSTVEKEKEKGHVFMSGGMFLLKEDLA